MAVSSVQIPFPIFNDRAGNPLESGYLYIGAAGLDPVSNPIAAYWDSALSAPATQPIRTIGGYPSYSGSPGRLYVDSDFSIRVLNKDAGLVYSAQNSKERISSDLISYIGPDGNDYALSDLADNADPTKGASLVGFIAPGGGACDVGDLASVSDTAKGAAMVGYLPDYVGAVGTSIANVLDEITAVFRWLTIAEITDVITRAGTLDVSAKIQLALTYGPYRLYFPTGKYRCDVTLNIPTTGKYICGDGVGKTIFDFSQTTHGALTAGHCVDGVCGSLVALPSIASDINLADQVLQFVSAPSLEVGDVFVIADSTDYSFSGFRPNYRAGEMFKVATVSGTTIGIQGQAFDYYDYTNTNLSLYKLNANPCIFKDFEIIGIPDTANFVWGLYLTYTRDTVLQNISSRNCSYAQIVISHGHNFQLLNCNCEEDFNSNGGDYGCIIVDSQEYSVVGGRYTASRHGLTNGGSFIPNRVGMFSSLFCGSSGTIQAFDTHGNSEYQTVTGCVIDGGVVMSGNFNTYTNNLIKACKGNGNQCFIGSEMRGLSVKIAGNTMVNSVAERISGYPTFIAIGMTGSQFSDSSYKGGTLSVENNQLQFVGETEGSVGDGRFFACINRGYNGVEPINVVFAGNVCTTSMKYANQNEIGIQGSIVSRPFDVVIVRDNIFNQCGGLVTRNTMAGEAYAAKEVQYYNNTQTRGLTSTLSDIKELISIKNNTWKECRGQCIYTFGINATYRTGKLHISNNTFLDSCQIRSSSSTERSHFAVYNASNCIIHGNVFGSDSQVITVASTSGFAVDETITGATSGVTATILSIINSTELAIGTTNSGTFTGGETLTGSVSTATTAYTSTATSMSYSWNIASTDNLWHGRNVDIDGLSPNIDGTVTTVTAI